MTAIADLEHRWR